MDEIEPIIQEIHCNSTSHGGINKTHTDILKQYCFIPRSCVIAYIARCRKCQDNSYKTKKSRKPLQPIISRGTFDHIVIDLIDYSNKPAGPGNLFHYVVHAVDHFSTFHFTDAIIAKTAVEVLRFIQRLFSIIGHPCVLHSDNGSEFKNAIVDSYLETVNVEHRRGKPRRPTTQGKVERANRTLKRAIRQRIRDANYQVTWYDVLFEATLSLNIHYSTLIKKSPYVQIFHQEVPHIIAKLEVEQDLNGDNSDSDTPSESEVQIMGETRDGRSIEAIAKSINDDSISNYIKNIAKMKTLYDKRYAPVIRHIGDIVCVEVNKEIARSGYATKIPAIVIGNVSKDGNTLYILGYNGKVIRGNFTPSDLVTVNQTAFATAVGIPISDINNRTGYARYGLLRNGKYSYITIQEVYDHYTSATSSTEPNSSTQLLFPHSDIDSDDSMEIDIHNYENVTLEGTNDNTALTPVLKNHPTARKNDSSNQNLHLDNSNVIAVYSCGLCLEEFQSSFPELITCYECAIPLHQADICKYGIGQVSLNSNIYCSRKCAARIQIYEVAIVGETEKCYNVHWNNGDVTQKLKTKMNTLAEYIKIVTEWNESKTRNPLPKPAPRNTRSRNATFRSKTSSKISTTPLSLSENSCCACFEMLNESNIHFCFGCKRRMHGYIICPKRELITLDENDNLYCKRCKPKAKDLA